MAVVLVVLLLKRALAAIGDRRLDGGSSDLRGKNRINPLIEKIVVQDKVRKGAEATEQETA